MSQQLEFSEKELAAIRAEFCKGFTDAQFDICMTFCHVRNLLPGKHVLFQLRRGKEWDDFAGAKVEVTKIVFITTIDASRLIAQRTGQYGGQAPEQYIYLDENGAPSIISDIPLPKLPVVLGQTALPREPWAVRTTLYRKDFEHPVISIARFDAYASTYKTADGPVLNEMWTRRGPEQLAKCSEMLSLRRGWPEELGGVYLDIELKNENEDVPVSVVPASVVPLPPPVPKVNQMPAQPVEAPRPNEKVVEARKEVAKVLDQIETAVVDIVQTAGQQLTERQEAVKAVIASNPSVKPASDIPPPEKKKGGRPKKSAESPDNGQPAPVDQGITQADIETAGKPAPVVDEVANQAAAQEFVESLDPTPTKEEQAGFSSRVRALAAAGANTQDLRNYILAVGHKDEPKQLTVANWNDALTRLETALGEGKDKLLEATKNAPLPAF
jgi:hypothetical protein